MSFQIFLEDLVGSRQAFEEGLTLLSCFPAGDVLDSILRLLARSTLPHLERERRLRVLLSRMRLGSDELRALATASAMLEDPILRNAVASLVPPELKHLAVQRLSAVNRDTANPVPNEIRPEPGSSKKPVPIMGLEVPQTTHIQEAVIGDFSDVIILSAVEQPRLVALLKGADYAPYRCTAIEDLPQLLAADAQACAILVEPSFLSSLSKEQQESLIAQLGGFSTLAFIRLHSEHLADSETVILDRITRQRCQLTSVSANIVSIRDRDFQQQDLVYLHEARDRLRAGSPTSVFVPGELSGSELRLLTAAISLYSRRRKYSQGFKLSSLTTRFFTDGASGAKVAQVTVNDFRMPVVVKIGSTSDILNEAKRFYTYVYSDNTDLNPEVHFHGSAALIIFDVITTSDDRPVAAPTLRKQLQELWYDEMRGKGLNDEPILHGYRQAVSRLSRMNARKCPNSDFAVLANPYISLGKSMEGRGFDWGFDESARSARDRADQLLSTASSIAVCHGDAHTGNILLGGSQGYIIDYALSGPGHPCSDLVKLELAVFFSAFQPLCTAEELIALQFDFAIGWKSIADLVASYPRLLSSSFNRLCLRLCILARDSVVEVLRAHGLGREHYVATRLLTAWQSLQVSSAQQISVRAVITALSRSV